jgi:hypothetical protein
MIERDRETIAQAFRMTGCSIDQPIANAAFIVRACNSHEQLVAALRRIAAADMGEDGSYYTNRENIRIARAALAAAEAA